MLSAPAVMSAPAKATAPRPVTTAKMLAKPVQATFTCSNEVSDLIESVNDGDMTKLQTCLQLGVDPNARQGESFINAALRGETDMARAMLPYMRDVAALERALAMAALRGHEDITDLIQANPNIKIDLNKPNSRYLAYAARAGAIGVMRKLAAAGARDDDGFAIASAISAERRDSFDFLLHEAKISPNAGNGMVLSMAIMSGDKYYVTSLLDMGAETKFFPVVAESLAEIRKLRETGGAEGEKFKNPAYDEIIVLVETAMNKPKPEIAIQTPVKTVSPAPL